MARRRPTKCTQKVRARIVQAVREGLTWKRAAQAGGITQRTLINWRQRGEEGDTPYDLLVKDLEDAEVDFERTNLAVIQRAATEATETRTEQIIEMADGTKRKEIKVVTNPPTWQPSAWLLERRFPERYSRTERRQHEGAIPVEPVGPHEVRITMVKADGTEEVTTREDADNE